MATSESIPTFGHDFTGLLNFLTGGPDELRVSPERFGAALGVAPQSFAETAPTGWNRAVPASEHLQQFMQESLNVLRAAVNIADTLISSTASIKTICAEAGFLDEASLMRSFKTVTGMTISQYRQQYGSPVRSPVTGRS